MRYTLLIWILVSLLNALTSGYLSTAHAEEESPGEEVEMPVVRLWEMPTSQSQKAPNRNPASVTDPSSSNRNNESIRLVVPRDHSQNPAGGPDELGSQDSTPPKFIELE